MTQFDLPPQALLQQSAARPLSGEELETYGKHAAAKYASGCASLNDAVVETVKSAGLSPEQVRRVCEFANTSAFLQEFKKEGSSTKYVHFDGGPADFSEVLKDLNDGGGGTVFDRGQADYAHAPAIIKVGAARTLQRNRSAMEKTAGVALPDENPADATLAEAFRVEKTAAPLRYHRPMGDVEELQEKLGAARDEATDSMSALETTLLDVTDEMYGHIKQAALSGTPLGHVVQAWDQALDPEPAFVKAAFAHVGPRLVADGIFGWDAMGASLEKTAGVGILVRDSHPIVESFGAYCTILTKLAELRATRQEFIDADRQLSTFRQSVEQHYPEHV